MQQEKRLNSDSSDMLSNQKSTSSQNLNAEGGQRMRTLQQQSQDAYDPVTRGKSRERISNEKLSTLQHPQPRKNSQQRNKGPQGSAAANFQKQNQIFAKQSIEVDNQNHQKSRQSSQGPVPVSAEPTSQGQGGRQGNTSSLAGKNAAGQAQRGTTPLRMGKQNTAKQSIAGSVGQVPQKMGQNQTGAKKQHPQSTQNATSKNKTNNQQIKGIMAAALASVKANQNAQISTLPQGVTKSQQKILKNNAQLDSNRQDQFLNFENDSTDLKILKASSVNNKYMTELIQGQRIMPEDMRAPAAARDIGSEYINTDEDEENPQPINKMNSSPLRQSTYNRPPKSEERKVFSQQDYNEIEAHEQFNQYPMGQVGAHEERGRSSGARPQSSYLPKNYSVERQPVSKVAFTDQKIPKKSIASPQKDQDEVLRLLQKHETSQSQLNQRLDIFEEEIIKRVREIQKYSKGLNSLVRKSVMPDLQAVQEKVIGLALGPAPVGGDRVGVIEDKIIQIHQQMEMQKVMVKNMQLNLGADINERFAHVQEQMSNIQIPKSQPGSGDEEIQQKLVEQNQLIGMLDEQMNSQEHQIQGIQQVIAERDQTINQLLENQNQAPVQNQNPNMSGILNEFEESISTQLQQKFEELEAKFALIDQQQSKQLEDSEGRDGLILQQNQDITNLYQANEQILENEKAFKVQIESMEAQMIEYGEILENQGGQKNDGQIEGLKHNIEGRLQICVKQLKEEMVQGDQKLGEGLEYKIEQIQQYAENMEQRIAQLDQNSQILQENSQSLELQFQAQFDEQSSQQDQRLKQMEQQILKAGGGSSNQQEMEAIYQKLNGLENQGSNKQEIEVIFSKLDALERQETPQIELILQKIDQIESQQDFDNIYERIEALENKDVFAVFETKMSPYKNQIEDLQLEITSKCLDLSTQQDSQVNSLILEIKQIQENFEQLQDIVVQTTQDVQAIQQDDVSDALAQQKIDSEKFRGHFEGMVEKLQAEIYRNSNAIQELEQKESVPTASSSISPDIELKLKSLEQKIVSSSDFDLKLNNLEDQFSHQVSTLDQSKDIQRLERQYEEIEIQLKNIFVQNSQEFEDMKNQLASYSRTSEVQKGLDRFEDVAGRNSDVRKDLQAQVDEIVQVLNNREPERDEELNIEVKEIAEKIKQIQNQFQQVGLIDQKLNEIEDNVQNQLSQYSRTSEVQKDLDRFENVAGRTSDVRKDLQAQVDDLSEVIRMREPSKDEQIYIQVQELAAKIEESQLLIHELEQRKTETPKQAQPDQSIQLIEKLQSKMDVLDEDFVDMQSQIRVIESDLENTSNKFEKQIEEIKIMKSSSDSTPVIQQSPDIDAKISKLQTEISDLSSKVSLDQKSTNAKIDVLSMDVSSLRNFEKQIRTSSSDLETQIEAIQVEIKGYCKQSQLAVLFKEQLDPQSSDILTMKHLINILQDSNFQAQIDEIKKSINDAKMRFSMPMPQSMHVTDVEEQQFKSNQKSKKSSIAPTSSKKPKDLDLSPIGQNQEKKFQETDDELQSKLQNMFPEKSEKQSQPFDQGYEEDEIEEYDHDDFEDLPSEPVEETHEQLYQQEVELPILEDKPPTTLDSFQNSSKSKVDEQEPEQQTEEEPISINSIDLGLMTEEQKEQATNQIMQELDFDSILKVQLEEVIQAIIMRQ